MNSLYHQFVKRIFIDDLDIYLNGRDVLRVRFLYIFLIFFWQLRCLAKMLILVFCSTGRPLRPSEPFTGGLNLSRASYELSTWDWAALVQDLSPLVIMRKRTLISTSMLHLTDSTEKSESCGYPVGVDASSVNNWNVFTKSAGFLLIF